MQPGHSACRFHLTLALLLLTASCQGGLSCTSAASPPKGPRVYVSNEESNDISVIDLATDQVVATVFVGKRPRGLRLSPDGRTLYVAVSGSPRAPPGVDESTLPPPDRAADGIALVDIATLKLAKTLESGDDPESFDLTPDGQRLYVSNEDAARASVVDLASGKVTHTVAVGREPEGVTMRPDGKVVYVTSEQDRQVFAIDTTSHQVLARIATKVAWTFSTGLVRGHEAAQLVVGGTMYVVTPYPNHLIALDLTKEGAPMKWTYEPQPSPSA